MRMVPVLSTLFVVALAGPASAQEWVDFISVEDGFHVNFPGQPRLEQTTYTSEFGFALPARVFRADRGQEHYSMTVVDYSGIEATGRARAAACPQGAETCTGQLEGVLERVIGPAYATQDIRGALVYASFSFIRRDAMLTDYRWNWTELVEGHQLQLTNRADQSRTFVVISMHQNKLYIQEGTVPAGAPEPGLFQQSLGFVDSQGRRIRYQAIYANDFHGLGIYPPPEQIVREDGFGERSLEATQYAPPEER